MNSIEKQKERIKLLEEQIAYIEKLEFSKSNKTKLAKLNTLLLEDKGYLKFLSSHQH